MKAEEVIRKLHASWLFTEELELIKAYAKDQIEKDRERVKLNAKVSMVLLTFKLLIITQL